MTYLTQTHNMVTSNYKNKLLDNLRSFLHPGALARSQSLLSTMI